MAADTAPSDEQRRQAARHLVQFIFWAGHGGGGVPLTEHYESAPLVPRKVYR